MQLHHLKPKITTHKPKRVGRGPGSGHGKTSTRGHKGAGQRAGRMHYIGFEGGNIPYLRKIPKRGFHSHRQGYQIINLEDIIAKLKGKKEITPKELKEVNLIHKQDDPIKILARVKNDLSWKATFKAHKFSRKAEKIIHDAGGKVEILPSANTT